MSEAYKQFLAEHRAKWTALPWYIKAWRRTKSRYWTYRCRLVDAWDVLLGYKEAH